MFRTYYTPKKEDLYCTLRCEVKPIGGAEFLPHIITSADIEIRLKFIEQIRIQHLHEDDFKELGMAFDVVPRALGEGKEGYIASAKIKHPRKEGVRMDIYFAQSTNWAMITFDGSCVYAGEVWNISELKKVLKRIHGDNIIQK